MAPIERLFCCRFLEVVVRAPKTEFSVVTRNFWREVPTIGINLVFGEIPLNDDLQVNGSFFEPHNILTDVLLKLAPVPGGDLAFTRNLGYLPPKFARRQAHARRQLVKAMVWFLLLCNRVQSGFVIGLVLLIRSVLA